MTVRAIEALLPHRPPFLWVDRIVRLSERVIETEKDIAADLELFAGHYPGNPLLPGVLVCEAIFQSGALLLAGSLKDQGSKGKIPVLTRIDEARFKRRVLPGETLSIRVELEDTVASLFLLKGSCRVAGDLAVRTRFRCALIDP